MVGTDGDAKAIAESEQECKGGQCSEWDDG